MMRMFIVTIADMDTMMRNTTAAWTHMDVPAVKGFDDCNQAETEKVI